MASEGTSTVPRMGSFKRAFLGYRRTEVDAAIAGLDARSWALERDAEDALARCRESAGAAARAEDELSSLSAMVIEREREIRSLNQRLAEANERHDRSIASLESVSAKLEEIQAQARGQATRIRMKALREAVEVGRRAQELTDAQAGLGGEAPSANGSDESEIERAARSLYEGIVKVEIGPFDDFSQLVGFEDAAGQIDATAEISVERFSEGRATLSMRLDEPVDLLRELEERSPLDFRVRRTADDNLILDVDDDPGPEQHAA
jgi:cell division septum initiation protein DivIVA